MNRICHGDEIGKHRGLFFPLNVCYKKFKGIRSHIWKRICSKLKIQWKSI